MHYDSLRQPGLWATLMVALALAGCAQTRLPNDQRIDYARALLGKAKQANAYTLKIDSTLGNPEAFTVNGRFITGGGPAGILYGVQECLAARKPVQPVSDKPDFALRGTVLFLMKDGSYDYELTPQEFPWFYDRDLLTRYFDYLFESRFNAIFLWSGNMFPSLVELPEYPDARTISQEQLLANQAQFRWFTDECAKRNISVLTHFYNIHLTKALAESRKIPMHYSAPDPFAAKFLHYTLVRFLTQFASVGLYVCPGEALASQYQPAWIRDVILQAAEDSGRHPWVVVRDWGLPGQPFKEACHYDNLFTELKHNVEMIVSPVPDPRHAFWTDGQHKHIVNVHEVADVKPFRWASPLFIREMVQEWQKAHLDGAEVYGRVSWRWPYALDKLAPDQNDVWPAGPKFVTFDRDSLWLQAFGRYLWKVERNPQTEAGFWIDRLTKRFGSYDAGKALYRWYNLTGPILPGLQNLTSVLNMNYFPTAIAKEQMVDDILAARTSIADDLQRNAARVQEVVAGSERYPSRPVDTFFFDRYKTEYNLSGLTNRYTMPVAEYAEKLAKHEAVSDAMTPDKVADLFVKMATEAEDLARQAATLATHERIDASGYVTDTQAIRLVAEYFRAKIKAAIAKRILQLTDEEPFAQILLREVENSLPIYRRLVELTDKTYIKATDMGAGLSWHNGLKAAEADLEIQKLFVQRIRERKQLGLYWIEAEEMDGSWKRGQNYKGYSGSCFRVADNAAQRAEDLTKTIRIFEPGTYTVWTRGLIGGVTPNRSFAIKINAKALPPTHGESGPPGGAFVWHQAGQIELPSGQATLAVQAIGKGFVCPDVIVLTKNAEWKPPEAP